jgi:hypothetical protein
MFPCGKFIFSPVSPVLGQKEAKRMQKTAFGTCWEEKTKKYGSRSIQGTVFVSPNGLQRAYVNVDTQALGKDPGGQEDCQNRSALFVAKDGKEHFDSVFTYQGEKGEKGNGIQLIDWSPDSKVLVADLLTWYYFSEGWEHHNDISTFKISLLAEKEEIKQNGQFRKSN